MNISSFHQLPPLFFALALLLLLAVAVLQVGLLTYAYEKMGISRTVALAILVISLLGSSVNMPILEIVPEPQVVGKKIVELDFGVQQTVPILRQWPETTVALNLGGAIIPTMLSIYLVVRNQIYGQAFLGIFAVSAVVHFLATLVPGMGITVPILIPPIVSAIVAMLLSRDYAAPLAYVSGCMGTLIGADLLNLHRIMEFEASIVSIGGAGTFDGVFLTGILAVLLAARPRRPEPRFQGPPDPQDVWPYERTDVK